MQGPPPGQGPPPRGPPPGQLGGMFVCTSPMLRQTEVTVNIPHLFGLLPAEKKDWHYVKT
jgi:hypothetical protein